MGTAEEIQGCEEWKILLRLRRGLRGVRAQIKYTKNRLLIHAFRIIIIVSVTVV